MHHHVAGVPLDLLMPEFWVPGMMSRQECSKFMGKPLWQQILQVSGEVSVLWLTRLTKEPMVFHESSYMGPLQCQIINKFFCYKDPIISTSRYMLANTHTTALWQDFEKKIQRESTNKAKDLGGTLSCVYFQPLASPPTHCFYIMVYPLASLDFFQTIPHCPEEICPIGWRAKCVAFRHLLCVDLVATPHGQWVHWQCGGPAWCPFHEGEFWAANGTRGYIFMSQNEVSVFWFQNGHLKSKSGHLILRHPHV